MNPEKVARIARYDALLTEWKGRHMLTEMASRKALGPGTFENSGKPEDWKAWEEALNAELELWLDLKEIWCDLARERPSTRESGEP
ncbi:MAG: hypothetical protein M1297_05600 [Nitrospirae bacterium]|jgi:hypothetical protein|nr:hypothetical protein [Nitrospirota bacterium]